MLDIPKYITELILDKVVKTSVAEVADKIFKVIKEEGGSKVIAYQENPDNKSVVIFVHGFAGSPEETFKNIPELLEKEEKLDGYDIISVGYSTSILPDIGIGIWSADPDINNLSHFFKTLLSIQFKKYDKISIVAHSMGGLIVQNAMLTMDKADIDRIAHFIMFGTPSGGLKLADSFISRLFKRSTKNMGANSEFILTLRKEWKEKFEGEYPFEFKTVAGLRDEFVQRKSSLAPFLKEYQYQIDGNHSTMVKAKDVDDTTNQCFNLILNDLSPTTIIQGNPFQLNQLIAKCKKIITDFKDVTDQIDANGLKNLALALDVLNENDDAIKILKAHSLTKENTDLMGILGGRYKRNYLFEGNRTDDAIEAVKSYTAGLEKSQEKHDNDQIYYHAINLAFMSLVYERNTNKSKSYAQLALDHCDESTLNTWELATIAEANLYLGNMNKAEEFYTKTLEQTKDKLRMRNSIYINARFAYEAIYGIDEL